jgi:putative phosphoribosyl transferase
VALDADMAVPEPATGVVRFAHGSGSSRHSPRNRYVAGELQAFGLATVLADLLTPAEEQLDARTGRLRFDIGLLAAPVMALTDWVTAYRPTADLPAGLFGASTGAAAALVAAARRPSRPRRRVPALGSPADPPDRRGPRHGGHRAQPEDDAQAVGEARLEVIAGASHLFSEPGALSWSPGWSGTGSPLPEAGLR